MAALVQVLLPAFDPSDQARRGTLDQVVGELTERFGGVTAYTRSPATGLWQSEGDTVRDTVVMVEVVVERLDRAWWGEYRRLLEARFDQDQIHARALDVEQL